MTDAPDLPVSIIAEQNVLGTILLNNDAFHSVAGFLTADHFYEPLHKRVYEVLGDMVRANVRATPGTIRAYLPADLAVTGDMDLGRYVAHLAAEAVSAHEVEGFARVIADMAWRRSLIGIGQAIADQSRKPADRFDTAGIVAEASAELFDVSAALDVAAGRDRAPTSYASVVAAAEERINSDSSFRGISTGLVGLDYKLGGMIAGDFMVIGARPAMGKSMLALALGKGLARKGYGVAFDSKEMTDAQLRARLLSSECDALGTRLPYQVIDRKRMHPDQVDVLRMAAANLERLPMMVFNRGNRLADIPGHIREARRWLAARKLKLDAYVIDYLGLVAPGDRYRGDRNREVGEISANLKRLAMTEEVVMIALHQLSRANESRKDKRPQLSDLRESGCLAGDTLIYLADGRWQRIDALVEQTPLLAGMTFGNRCGVVGASKVFCTGHKTVFRVITGSGRNIRATSNHKFLTSLDWQPLADLRVGDCIAVPVNLPGPVLASMSGAEVTLLAHLIGDGCVLPRHAVQYTTNDPDAAELVARLASELFPGKVLPRVNREGRANETPTWMQVYLPATEPLTHGRFNPIAAWFRELGIFGLRAYEKRVPKELFSQPAQIISVFLGHLWSTDGTIAVQDRPSRGKGINRCKTPEPIVTIAYSTTSEGLAHDVHDLLLRVGIKSRVQTVPQKKGRTGYQVVICGLTGKRRFIERLPLTSGYRTEQALAAMVVLSRCGDSDTYDGDIYWDTIASIEPDGEAPVYDITVPYFHNFIADGVIVHNSIEQDADVVAFVYREAYYAERPGYEGTAILSDDLRRDMELIVAKNRHGPVGTVHLWCDMATGALGDKQYGGSNG